MFRFMHLFLVLMALTSVARASNWSQDLASKLDSLEKQIPLSGTLTVKKEGVTYTRMFGNADDVTGRPNTADSRYLIASNTKQFIGAAILRLEEQGLLKTSDPVAKHFPEYPAANLQKNGVAATIEHLAQHEAGLFDVYETPEIQALIYKQDVSVEQIVNAIKSRPLVRQPGTQYEYSNTGYILLGEIIRRVTGLKTVGEFLAGGFFKIAGMKNTTMGLPLDQSLVSICYELTPEGRKNYVELNGIVDLSVSDTFTDGNVYSTAPEMAAWMETLLEGKVLGTEAMKKLFTPSKLGQYGYGWSVTVGKSGTVFYSHDGLFLAYQSMIGIFPKDKIYFAFLGNQVMSDKDKGLFYKTLIEKIK